MPWHLSMINRQYIQHITCLLHDYKVFLLVSSSKHVVDNVEKLHNPLIQVQILQALEQIRVSFPIRPLEDQFLGFGLCGQDLNDIQHRLDGDYLPCCAQSRHGYDSVPQGMQLGADLVHGQHKAVALLGSLL